MVAVLASFVFTVLGVLLDEGENPFGFALAWGIAIAFMATLQMIVALTLERSYDRSVFRALLVGALYPVAFWLISATAALHSEVAALVRGPRGSRVVWNIPREHIDGQPPTEKADADQRRP